MGGSLDKFDQINSSKLKIFKMVFSPFFEKTPKKVCEIKMFKKRHISISKKNFEAENF